MDGSDCIKESSQVPGMAITNQSLGDQPEAVKTGKNRLNSPDQGGHRECWLGARLFDLATLAWPVEQRGDVLPLISPLVAVETVQSVLLGCVWSRSGVKKVSFVSAFDLLPSFSLSDKRVKPWGNVSFLRTLTLVFFCFWIVSISKLHEF